MKLKGISEDSLLRSLCRDSFFDFVKEFWSVVIQEEPVWNWHIEYLAGEAQKVAERVFAGEPRKYDLIINVPPGTTKSTIFSVMFTPWTWTRMPSARHICASHTQNLSLDLSRRSRDVVMSEKYQRLFPLTLKEDQATKGYWINSKGGDRFSCTVGGQNPTGFHAHFLTIDDPIDPQQAVGEIPIETANDFMNETISSRKVDKLVSVITLVMQRLHQNDPAGNRLSQWKKKKGGAVKHICLPAEEFKGGKISNIQPEYLRRFYRKGLLDCDRLPKDILKEMRDKGEYFYSGQYLQDPIPESGLMFDSSKFHLGEHPPPLTEFRRVVRYWDKAYSAGAGAFTVGVKMGLDKKGRFWVLNVKRGQWESFKREEIIRQTAFADTKKVHIIVEQEPAAGKESANSTVRNLAGFIVKKDRRGGVSDENKVRRADPFAAQVNGENVWLAPGDWNEDYIEEHHYFPQSTYKDQVDASSGAFNELTRKKVATAIRT